MVDIPKTIGFAERWASDSLSAISACISKGSFRAAISGNMPSAFAELLFKGLVEWRHHIADPSPMINQALGVAHHAFAILPQVRSELEKDPNVILERLGDGSSPAAMRPWRWFPFPDATLASMLLHKIPDSNLLEVTPGPEAWNPKKHDDIDWYNFLNAGIVWAITRGQRSDSWEYLLAYGRKRKRCSLEVETYEHYVNLIEFLQTKNVDKIQAGLDRAQELYVLRRRDNNFKEGRKYDGGDGGELTVDFRLATILRCSLANDLSFCDSLESMHKWRW